MAGGGRRGSPLGRRHGPGKSANWRRGQRRKGRRRSRRRCPRVSDAARAPARPLCAAGGGSGAEASKRCNCHLRGAVAPAVAAPLPAPRGAIVRPRRGGWGWRRGQQRLLAAMPVALAARPPVRSARRAVASASRRNRPARGSDRQWVSPPLSCRRRRYRSRCRRRGPSSCQSEGRPRRAAAALRRRPAAAMGRRSSAPRPSGHDLVGARRCGWGAVGGKSEGRRRRRGAERRPSPRVCATSAPSSTA